MSDKRVDFQELIQGMAQAEVAETERPAILGGRFSAERLDAFLSAWRSRWGKMPWRIWEHVSHIDFSFSDEPAEPLYLQRAEIFGEGGHLSLRCDVRQWLWHYVGEPIKLPLPGFEGSEACRDFWSAHPDCKLRCYEESVLLWGERKEGFDLWWDDRAAAARLIYPEQSAGRVHLDFLRFTENGQTAFVWYRNLRTVTPETRGDA
jgi:hypothetical protein